MYVGNFNINESLKSSKWQLYKMDRWTMWLHLHGKLHMAKLII